MSVTLIKSFEDVTKQFHLVDRHGDTESFNTVDEMMEQIRDIYNGDVYGLKFYYGIPLEIETAHVLRVPAYLK